MMELRECSTAVFLYDLFEKIEIDAFHCWFNFYSPYRDDYDWIEVNVRLRLNDFQLQIGLYPESVIAHTFRAVFDTYSTEKDLVERAGFTGIYYIASFTDGKTYPVEEGRSRVKDKELKEIKYQVIRKLRIECLKILEDWSDPDTIL